MRGESEPMEHRALRFAVALSLFLGWVAFLAWMVFNSSEKPREIPVSATRA
jgi:hypothetical protein